MILTQTDYLQTSDYPVNLEELGLNYTMNRPELAHATFFFHDVCSVNITNVRSWKAVDVSFTLCLQSLSINGTGSGTHVDIIQTHDNLSWQYQPNDTRAFGGGGETYGLLQDFYFCTNFTDRNGDLDYCMGNKYAQFIGSSLSHVFDVSAEYDQEKGLYTYMSSYAASNLISAVYEDMPCILDLRSFSSRANSSAWSLTKQYVRST